MCAAVRSYEGSFVQCIDGAASSYQTMSMVLQISCYRGECRRLNAAGAPVCCGCPGSEIPVDHVPYTLLADVTVLELTNVICPVADRTMVRSDVIPIHVIPLFPILYERVPLIRVRSVYCFGTCIQGSVPKRSCGEPKRSCGDMERSHGGRAAPEEGGFL